MTKRQNDLEWCQIHVQFFAENDGVPIYPAHTWSYHNEKDALKCIHNLLRRDGRVIIERVTPFVGNA